MTWLTETEAAEYLRLYDKSGKLLVRALRNMRYKGLVDASKIGGVVLYQQSALDALREKCKWEGKRKAINSSKDKTDSGTSTTQNLGALVARAKEIVKSQKRY